MFTYDRCDQPQPSPRFTIQRQYNATPRTLNFLKKKNGVTFTQHATCILLKASLPQHGGTQNSVTLNAESLLDRRRNGPGINLLELVFKFFAKAIEQTIVFSNFFGSQITA